MILLSATNWETNLLTVFSVLGVGSFCSCWYVLFVCEDNTTYQQLQKDPTPNTEKTVNKFVSQLVADNKITKTQSYRLKSSNERAPVLYGLPKLHKENTPLRPIVSFTGSPTYNLSKDLARILSELTGKSDHHVRNSKDFAKFITSITINDDETF